MSHCETIRRLSHPLAPMATDQQPRLARLDNIRTVLFDVYGTLIISASGDISLATAESRDDAMATALAAVGIEFTGPGDQAIEKLHEVIYRHHAICPYQYPEVDIREVWSELLLEFDNAGWLTSATSSLPLPLSPSLVEQLAIEYEMRVNPVWPMPGATECLVALQEGGIGLGIVSNAQFFTPELFGPLLGHSLLELGFQPSWCHWSHEHRHAKPGTFLYERAVDILEEHRIAPRQVLYVGNDMRNDVAPAAQVGFRTALFAGDARSLRLREGDPLVARVEPDVVITELGQIPSLFGLASD